MSPPWPPSPPSGAPQRTFLSEQKVNIPLPPLPPETLSLRWSAKFLSSNLELRLPSVGMTSLAWQKRKREKSNRIIRLSIGKLDNLLVEEAYITSLFFLLDRLSNLLFTVVWQLQDAESEIKRKLGYSSTFETSMLKVFESPSLRQDLPEYILHHYDQQRSFDDKNILFDKLQERTDIFNIGKEEHGTGRLGCCYLMYYLNLGESSLQISRANDRTTALEITYASLAVRLAPTAASSELIPFHCLLGLKTIRSKAFLLLASSAKKVMTVGFSTIYQIEAVSFVGVGSKEEQSGLLGQRSQEIAELQSLFAQGFHYYSESYDLTMPYLLNKGGATASQLDYYSQFRWNSNLASMDGGKDELQCALFGRWCAKVIQGYVEKHESTLPDGSIFRYFLISRRSTRKAGTRFYSRGIDDEGNVANFVETEQLAILGDLLFTQLQIRGSVPAFFAQEGVNGIACEMVIERSPALTRTAYQRHFRTLQNIYSRIFAVNLLSDRKSDERQLSNFYEQMVHSESGNLPLRYQFYDFHEECKGDKFDNTQQLMDKLQGVIEAMGFNCVHLQTGEVRCLQKGVFRTNCLDCLDRTNYVESRLALRALKDFLIQYADTQTRELVIGKQLLDLPVNEKYPLLAGFNGLWADNGDAISMLYTSIASTHTDITRTGERTFFGTVNHKFKSLMRFYAQFGDHSKHEAILSIVTPSASTRNNLSLHDFHTTLLFSSNAAQNRQQVLENLKERVATARPTLVVCFVYEQIGWLERVKKVFGGESAVDGRGKELGEAITKIGFVKTVQLKDKGCWMGVYCADWSSERVGEVKWQIFKGQTSGQALMIRMRLQDSSFIFAGVNCSDFQQFLQTFDEMHEKGFQVTKLGQFRTSDLKKVDYRVILGNTGSKITLSQSKFENIKSELKAMQIRKEGDRAKLIGEALDKDELSNAQGNSKNRILQQYSEGTLDFIPSSNRMLFWNEEGIILRVRDYSQVGEIGFVGILDCEVGRGRNRALQA